MKNKVLNYIDENKDQLFTLLSELIKINSENMNTVGNEANLMPFISEKLKGSGAEYDIYCPDTVEGILENKDYLPGRNTNKRPNITGCIKGRKSDKKIMLAAHTDTVPIGDRALWKTDPLGGTIKNGNIYGRGACDDKYAIATSLFIFKAFKDLNLTLDGDLYFTGYVDEEFGGGNGALAAGLKYPCDAVVNLDCKNMRIWNCACGGRRDTLTLIKNGISDTCDDTMDALVIAKEELHKFGARRKSELDKNKNFNGTSIPEKSMRILNFQSGLNTNDRNMAKLDFSFYTDKPEEVINKELFHLAENMNKRMAHLGIKVESIKPMTRYFRYALSDKDNEYIKLLKNSAKEAIGEEIVSEASCLSDLNIFINNASSKSFSFGIGRDFDVEGGAHLADEFIECDRLVAFAKAVAAFICEWGNVQNGN